MFRNYLKITVRNLLKYKTYSFINISGLAIGIACTILILLWIQDELRYDRFHENDSSLYRIMMEENYSDGKTVFSTLTPALLGPSLVEEIPEISQSARFLWQDEILFKVGEKKFKEKGRYADGSMFNILSFPIIQGNADNVLPDINSVVISETLAKKYFGAEDPIGKSILLRDYHYEDVFMVTGVFEDIPTHSSLRFDFIIPLENYLKRNEWALKWGTQQFRLFVQLNPFTSQQEVDDKIKHFLKNYLEHTNDELFLQPIEDMYLYSSFQGGRKTGGRIDYVRSFSMVALFVLLIACVNFMILSTAKSFTRAREVGIKKVIGSRRIHLIAQFIGETAVITLIAAIIAILIVELVLPQFNQFTLKSMNIPYTNPVFLFTILIIALFTSIVSGSYPAFFLSSFTPIKVLKGDSGDRLKGSSIRKGLIVFQFVLSIVLIIGAIVINRQIRFIKNRNLIMDRENLVYFVGYDGIDKYRETFVHELRQLPGIKNITFTNQNPLSVSLWTTDPKWEGKASTEEIKFNILQTDFNFLQTMNMELKEGRDFSIEMATDQVNFLINEEAARLMRMQSPLGQTLSFWGDDGTIIGVIKDYHFQSLHSSIEPLIIMIEPENCLRGCLRTETGQTVQAIASLKKVYEKYEPDYPLEYIFVDQEYERMYKSEMITGILANYFTLLAIFISCLGLYGLAAFSIARRIKEIGVRKALGASVTNIIAMFSKEFTKWIIYANIIAWPFAWYAMNKWLQNYAYHIAISWWIFFMAGVLSVMIAFITVSYQSIKAATANPVESLRYE